ncbi:unnamed protein product [Polarella glacialis]|uniref:Uncharacterized protein n=2 Tax=Polarella glacialis TaxID=89957 RepID=A0A813FIN6_POLGL|nr:unnamed protein product [Polarella glacialis]
MAMSEISKVFKTEAERVRGWEVALGIEQPNEADDREHFWEDLQTIERLEIVEAQGLEVEYRMHCGLYGLMHEKAIFMTDPKAGFIYTGESAFFNKEND